MSLVSEYNSYKLMHDLAVGLERIVWPWRINLNTLCGYEDHGSRLSNGYVSYIFEFWVANVPYEFTFVPDASLYPWPYNLAEQALKQIQDQYRRIPRLPVPENIVLGQE